MKINELKQVGEREEEYEEIIPAVYNELGEISEEEKTVTKTRIVPIMQAVTRDMTAEEGRAFLDSQPKDERTYEQKVEDYIREKYSVSDELALLRQRDIKTEEFTEYNGYCEQCKQKAKGN